MSHILILGDGMMDIHEFGTSKRLSPEAPVPIICVHKQSKSFGGAANVAAHITSAGIKTTFAYKASPRSKSHEDFSIDCLINKIEPVPLYINKEFPLTTKHRIWSGKQQVCRIDQENVDVPSTEEELEWLKEIVSIIDNRQITCVIMSDYNKGTLTDNLIDCVAEYCYTKNIPTILDPKRPTFYKLKKLTVVKPNNREIESTNMSPTECSKKMGETLLIHTKGKDGVSVYQNGEFICHQPTVSQEVFDVTGCGDSLCAMLGIAIAKKVNYNQVIAAANKAASFTITHLGCYVLNREEIGKCLYGSE